jgi:dihydropyrimidine dehydrogenase (NAD+) subunit PreT
MSNTIKSSYLESEKGFDARTAAEEAARCLLCHDAPCSRDCPAGTDPGTFIQSIRFRNVKGAAETIRENNVMGGSCARVCPYDRLCEQACSKCGIDRPIEIGKLQRYALEAAKDMKILAPGESNGKKVAVIGAGPAGIACATELAKFGFDATVFEKEAKAGGVLTYGIPPARLPQDVVDADISAAKDAGVKFEFGKEITETDALKAEYDAVFIGIGLSGSKVPDIPGKDKDGVYTASDFLKEARMNNGSAVCENKKVVVIGGGDVTMDCAVTAKLSGAKEVSIWYRRTIDEAPANLNEILYATERGIPMTNNMAPAEIFGADKVEGMIFKGRNDDASATVGCDIVVFAIGQKADTDFKVEIKGDGEATSDAKIFAGGDIANGGKTVVEAVKAGKLAANYIKDSLK